MRKGQETTEISFRRVEKQQKEFQRSTLKLKVYSILISTLAGELLEICAYHFLMWKLGAL